MRKYLVTSSFIISLFSLLQLHRQSQIDIESGDHATPRLEFLWETEAVLNTVESVIYDAASNFIYTTNIEGHFMRKDGKGSISKLSLDGKVIERDWVSGLNAPTGTGIFEGKLYVTDIDRIIEVDIASGDITNAYEVEGAKAFNDIEVSRDGTVYASDTGGNQIFALKEGKVRRVAENIDTPNGLLQYKDKFLITRWTPKSLDFLDLSSGELSQLSNGLEGPDGIEAVEDLGFLVSGFNGLIHFITHNGTKTLLLDTSEERVNAADIDYVEDKKLLLVPTMSSNKIMAYRLVY